MKKAIARCFVALTVTMLLLSASCEPTGAEDPVERAKKMAQDFLSSQTGQRADDHNACQLFTEKVYGRSEILPFSAGSSRIEKLAEAPPTYRVSLPYWCSGVTATGATVRLAKEMVVTVDWKGGTPQVRSHAITRSEPLDFWRQFLPWSLLMVVAPLIVYCSVAALWLCMLIGSGSPDLGYFLRATAQMTLHDLPWWFFVLLRLTTLFLVGWLGLNYFGSWLAVGLSIVAFLFLISITEGVYFLLVFSLLRGISSLTLALILYCWLPGISIALAVWLLWSQYYGWTIVAGLASLIIGGFCVAHDDRESLDNQIAGIGGIVAGLVIVLAGIVANIAVWMQ